jgi:hypothetical protein
MEIKKTVSRNEKRDIDILVENVQSWLGKTFVFIKKGEIRSLYGFIIIAFAIGIFIAIIMTVNIETSPR